MPKKKGGKRFQVPRRTRLPPGARWAQKGQASGDSAGSDKQNPPVAEAVGGGKLWSDDWHGHPERLLATEVVRSRMIKLYEAVKESGGEGAAEAAVAVLELPPATELVRLLAGIQAAEERLLGYGIRTKDQDSAEPLNLTRLPSALFAPEKCGAAPAEGSRDAATLDAIASMLKMALDHARAVVTEQQAQSGAVRATRGARAVTAVDTLKLAEFVPVEEQPSSSSNPFASPGPGTVAAESPGDVKARRLALLRALRPSVSLATPHPRVRFEESEFLKYWERMRQEQAWMKRSSLLHSCTTAERCLEQLAKAVTEHGGVVVAADDAGAETLDYIVHPAALLSPEEAAVDIDDVEFLRAVRRDPDQCLVHWWYYPDSYDCWVPATEVDPPTGEEPVKSSPPVHVHLRFLSDLDLYNEWMNPEDYELDADELAVLRGEKDPGNAAAERQAAVAAAMPGDISSPAKSKKSKKRHSSSGESSRESKRRKEESSGKIRLSGSSLYRPGFHGVPALASLQAPSLTVTSVYGNLESSDNGDWISAPYGGVPLNLPVHTVSWFRFDEIHERERNSLPEFFDMSSRSKTPAVYSQWRNFMVATYQQNPAQYLTVTSCRRGLAGDVGAIMRVHAFLEHWGLINFAVTPEDVAPFPHPQPRLPTTAHGTSSASAGASASVAREPEPSAPGAADVESLRAASAEAASAIREMPEPTSSSSSRRRQRAGKSASQTSSGSLALRRNIFDDPASQQNDNPAKRCTVCSDHLSVAGPLYFVWVPASDSEIPPMLTPPKVCARCHADNRLPQITPSADGQPAQGSWVKTEATPDSKWWQENAWTDQETLLLLSGIEEHGEDWQAVSDFVATKSPEECLSHFIRLPIEEPYLETQLRDWEPPSKSSLQTPGTLPNFVEDARNPVMTLVSFLASSVNQEVAGAAAQAAMRVLLKNRDQSAAASAENGHAASNGDVEMAGDSGSSASSDVRPADQRMQVDAAAAASLAVAAEKAQLIAEAEEKSMRRLALEVVSLQLRKMELKLKHFEELDQQCQADHLQLAQKRKALLQEQIMLKRELEKVRGKE